jgi:HK97 family phage portal protein
MAKWATEFRDFMSSVVSFPQDFLGAFGLPPSESGAIVNEFSAIQIATYMACIRAIANPVATVPLNVYERKPDGSEVVAYDHSLFSLLHNQPNPEVTAADFRQCMQLHILISGNAYAEIIRNNGGQPVALYVRSPFTTFPYRDNQGRLIYKTHDDPSGAERTIDGANMLHVKGLGLDSLVGLSPVKYYAREVLGIEISAQAYSAKFFANQATPSGYLQSPSANLKPNQKLQALNSWMQAHSKGNSHMPAILEAGWKWETVGLDPDKTQLAQLRELNRSQICAIFGVPEHMAGGNEDSKATTEQKALEFLTFTLKPWFVKWEQNINTKLFSNIGRNANKFFAKFDTTELERADYKTALQGLQMGRYAGLITANEGRKQLGMNPYEEKQLTSKNPADRLLQPVNMVFVDESILDDAQEVPPAPGSDSVSESENPVPASQDKPKGTGVTEKNSADSEIKHYFVRYSPLFLDSFRRIQARKKPDSSDFQRTFSPVLISVASAMSLDPTASEPVEPVLSADLTAFIHDYIDGMAHRAGTWQMDTATASAEFKRALIALRGKVSTAASVIESE